MSTPFWKTGLFDASESIEAVIDISGGLTAVAVHLRTSPQTVSGMRDAKRVTNAVFAALMEELAERHGRPDITVRVLSGLDELPSESGNGPQKGRSGPKGSSPHGLALAPKASSSVAPAGAEARVRASTRRAGKRRGRGSVCSRRRDLAA